MTEQLRPAPPGVYPAVEANQPPASHPAPYTATDSLALLRHRWWVVALATLLGLGAAGAWAQTQEPVWESTTSVLVHPAEQDTNVVGGRTQGEVNLDTEAQLVRSTAVAAGAAELLATEAEAPDTPPALAAVPPDELARRVSVEVPPNTSVLVITFSDPTPAGAQAGARAFAEAYLQHREQSARSDLAARTTAIETKIEELNSSLTEVNERLLGALPDSSVEANLLSRHATVTSQLNTMTGRLDELVTATVAAGTVISEARLPTHPSAPQPAIILASGAALGLVVGVGAAGLSERLARRVHRPGDVSRRLGLPVLAALSPATAPRRDEIASPYGPSGRAFDRLRNEVVASERSSAASDAVGFGASERSSAATGRVIVVTSASSGVTSSLIATNLAASLSRSGHEVVLVGARVAQDAGDCALTQLLGVATAPGLSEVLAGRVPAARALQRSPRHPRMRALTMGATATATGLLQSPALRATLTILVAQAGYVIVDAPATSASADAQSLASHADAALLVVERRRARLAEVADAADQLRRVGTPLLGAIVVPGGGGGRARAAPLRGEREPAPSPANDTATTAAAEPARQALGTPPPSDEESTGRARPTNGRRPAVRPYPLPSGEPSREPAHESTADGQTVVMPRVDADGAAAVAGAAGAAEPSPATVPVPVDPATGGEATD
jgi:Mrp family chromosome partitioning ATPase